MRDKRVHRPPRQDKAASTSSGESSHAFGRPCYRVSIVDDDAVVLTSLRHILKLDEQFRCSGCYETGKAAMRGIGADPPEVVLMDIGLPDTSGLECGRDLLHRFPRLLVVMMSALDDRQTVEEAIRVGCHGYLTKPFGSGQCLAVLRCAVSRFHLVNLQKAGYMRDHCLRRIAGESRCPTFTERERRALAALAEGAIYKEAAERVGVSNSMIHKIIHGIYRKLKVNNRTAAIDRWRCCSLCGCFPEGI